MKDKHPIIGIILFALLFFQAPFGYLHHLGYKRVSGRTIWSYFHLWIGRITITLGIINGILGFRLSNNTKLGLIIYACIAAIIWILYVLTIFLGERRRARARALAKTESGDREAMVQQALPSTSGPAPPVLPAIPSAGGITVNSARDAQRRGSNARRLSDARDISPIERSMTDWSPRLSRHLTNGSRGERRSSHRVSAVSLEWANERAQQDAYPPGYSVPVPPEGFYGRSSRY